MIAAGDVLQLAAEVKIELTAAQAQALATDFNLHLAYVACLFSAAGEA